MPLTFGQLFGASIRTLRSRFKDVLPMLALIVGLMLIGWIAAGYLVLGRFSEALHGVGIGQSTEAVRTTILRSIAGDDTLHNQIDTFLKTAQADEAHTLMEQFQKGQPEAATTVEKLLRQRVTVDYSSASLSINHATDRALTDSDKVVLRQAKEGNPEAVTIVTEAVRSALAVNKVDRAVTPIIYAQFQKPQNWVFFGCAGLLFLFIYLTMQVYEVLLALGAPGSFGSLFTQARNKALPLLGLWGWMIVRSFVWLPLLAIGLGVLVPSLLLFLPWAVIAVFVCSFYFFPRYGLAVVLLVRDGKGIYESVQLSFERSRGYWRKIMGNGLAYLICLGILFRALQFIINRALLSLTPLLPAVSAALLVLCVLALLQQLNATLQVFFFTHLAVTLLENPSQPGSKTSFWTGDPKNPKQSS